MCSGAWAVTFLGLWLFRYVRLIVNCLSHWTFRPIPLPDDPSYTADDVTIIIPTIDGDGAELRSTVRSCLAANPFEILLVTIDENWTRAVTMANLLDDKKIRVLSIPQANKRHQMCKAIPAVQTPITILADDDVCWPRPLLDWILAPFQDACIGGVGTCQRLKREAHPNIWNFLGACYLERRNFDISACTHIDGGLPCLSGRTAACRTAIIQDPAFMYEFANETWGTYQLNADDDNFITRWLVNHGWKTHVQYHPEAEVITTLEDNPKFLKQCLRWSRSNWRSNVTSMFVECTVWWRHPWSTYAVQQTTLTAWALPVDSLLLTFCWKATAGWTLQAQCQALMLLITWILLSKFVKLLGHFYRYPADLVFFPLYVLFGYIHGIIKLWALCTLSETTWGSREGADRHDQIRMIRLPDYTSTSNQDGTQTADDTLAMDVLPFYNSDDIATGGTASRLDEPFEVDLLPSYTSRDPMRGRRRLPEPPPMERCPSYASNDPRAHHGPNTSSILPHPSSLSLSATIATTDTEGSVPTAVLRRRIVPEGEKAAESRPHMPFEAPMRLGGWMLAYYSNALFCNKS